MTTTTPPNPLAGWRPSGHHAQDEADVRTLVGAWLRSHEGMRSSGPTEGAYEALILPTDEPRWRARYADEAFSCALRFRAALYHLGVRHPLVVCPYRERVGRAVEDLATVARSYGALVEGSNALQRFEPREGDALCSLGRAGPHVSCVTLAQWLPGAGLELECADGGQGHKGSMAVDRNVYLYTGLALRSVEEPHSHASPGKGLPLVWTIDLWQVLLNSGALADR
ncbi:MAG TPA: hypothetical protein VFS43_29485 [Polyangiaceae bacterium]|nr:hypothetical protein [Polyangiaceae bacterium]